MPTQLLTVSRSHYMSPYIKRLYLAGDDLNFTTKQLGLHIKLFFKKPHQKELHLPNMINGKVTWPALENRPIARTYSVADFCPINKELAVDFVVHDTSSPAASFAYKAESGDQLGMAGPGPKKLHQSDAKAFLFIGDLSALPAISAIIKQLPKQTPRTFLFETPYPQNSKSCLETYFQKDPGFIQIFKQTMQPQEYLLPALVAHLAQVNLPDLSVTLAGEHQTVICLKNELLRQGIPKENLYAVPYWRHNMNEEVYHAQRHQVIDN